MIDIENFFVSVYTNNHSVKNIKVPLVNVLRGIRSGEVKDKVLAIRRYAREGDLKAANALKSALPAFTVSGVYKGSHSARNLVEPTCLKVLDFDIVPDLEALRAVCEADPHTVSCFGSPMKGFKVIAHVENSQDRHAEAYELVRMHYEEITGLQVDTSGKDICRTCYFSYDPQCYIAALYTSFVLPIIPSSEEATPSCHSAPSCHSDSSHSLRMTKKSGMQGGEESFSGRESDFIRANLLLHPLREGNRNQGAFVLGCKAAAAGCDFNAVFATLTQSLCSEDFPETELKRCLESAYQKVTSGNDESDTKNGKGAGLDKWTNSRYRDLANDTVGEDVHFESEELRRRTPLFGEEVYENIPTSLGECLEDDMLPRSRDVRLLACLTAYSSLIPCTLGQYKRECYTPHLYSWVFAPPASGKGAASAALHLTDVVQHVIECESDRLQKEYITKMDDYNDCRRRNRKVKGDAELPERPEEPPYRSLVIPASISLSRMVFQLRDNGELGGFLFDTEAETLANTNSQDYGKLDSVLCKASEHEPVSATYLTHGKKPVSCKCPRLAMMLTGTPTQLTGLLNYTEKGLASRTLIMTYGREYHYEPAGEGNESTEDRFERLAHRAYELFRFCQEHPLNFHFTKSQWKELNRVFERLARTVFLEERDDLAATVNRYGRTVMRVAMVLTRLEQFEEGNTERHIYCSERAFRVAMSVVVCCFEHCRLLFTSLGRTMAAPLEDPNKKRFPLECLPERFTRAEAVELGKSIGMNPKKVDRLLEKMNGLEIKKLGRALYEKYIAQSL